MTYESQAMARLGDASSRESGLNKRLLSKFTGIVSAGVIGLASVANTGCTVPTTYDYSSQPGFHKAPQPVYQGDNSDEEAGTAMLGLLMGAYGVQKNIPEMVYVGNQMGQYGAAKAGRSEINIYNGTPGNNANPEGKAEEIRPFWDAEPELMVRDVIEFRSLDRRFNSRGGFLQIYSTDQAHGGGVQYMSPQGASGSWISVPYSQIKEITYDEGAGLRKDWLVIESVGLYGMPVVFGFCLERKNDVTSIAKTIYERSPGSEIIKVSW